MNPAPSRSLARMPRAEFATSWTLGPTLLLLPLLLALVASPTVGVSDAHAFSGGPPDAHTGAPGENTCTFCHLSFPLNSGSGSLELLDLPPAYEPGQTYRLRVSLSDPDAQRWGFEMTALDVTDLAAGALDSVDTNTQDSTAPSGREYLKHTFTGTAAGTTGSRQWSLDWTAPAEGTGPVTFWIAGNAANNNLFNTGDRIYNTHVTVDEATSTSAPAALPAARLLPNAPNPFNPRTTLRFELDAPSDIRLEIVDARGRLVRVLAEGVRSAGRHELRWNGRDAAGAPLSSGVYRARLVTTDGVLSQALTLIQ